MTLPVSRKTFFVSQLARDTGFAQGDAVASSTGPGDAAFEYNADSPTATRLAEAMIECGESVNSLAKTLFKGHRKTVQRWLDGKTISKPNREKLAAHFGLDEEELAPEDRLRDLRPLLAEVDRIRRERGLKPATIAAELHRLAAGSRGRR